MRPMIKRVSDERRHRRAIRLKFIIIRCVARDKTFAYPARPHSSPFVMVCAEPELRYVFITLVIRYVCRVDMAMIIDYRQVRRICVIEHLRNLGVEQKIVVHKFIHSRLLKNYTFFRRKPPEIGGASGFRINYTIKSLQMQ